MSALVCTTCGKQFPVFDEDEDSAVDEAVHHLVRAHGANPHRLDPNALSVDESNGSGS